MLVVFTRIFLLGLEHLIHHNYNELPFLYFHLERETPCSPFIQPVHAEKDWIP